MVVPSPKLRHKTDNHDLTAKLVLRRMVVKKAQIEPLHVLDLFAGLGSIWNALREEPRSEHSALPLNVESYTPVDSAAKQPGQIRAKITPRLIAALDEDNGLSRYNCIDVDTFGDPFEIWHEVLTRIRIKTAVFLTRGKVTYGAGRMPVSNHAKKVMGIPAEWNVPGKIELLEYADRCQLLEQCPTARITAGWCTRFPRVDYYGLIVEPKGEAATAELFDSCTT